MYVSVSLNACVCTTCVPGVRGGRDTEPYGTGVTEGEVTMWVWGLSRALCSGSTCSTLLSRLQSPILILETWDLELTGSTRLPSL